MARLVVFEAGFVAIKCAVADLAVVVDVHIRVAIAAGDDDTGLLFFGQVEARDHLENFNQDVNLER